MVGLPESIPDARPETESRLDLPVPLVRLGPGGDFEVALIPSGRRLVALAAVPGTCWPRPEVPKPVRGHTVRDRSHARRPGAWSRLLARLWSLFRSDADQSDVGDLTLARLVAEQREQLRSLELASATTSRRMLGDQ